MFTFAHNPRNAEIKGNEVRLPVTAKLPLKFLPLSEQC